ncbi:endonuclease III [bacterium]|nr:endonuclease III [FCB group bacterium]MBL7190510.1 endonuclease III [bacterium]
MKSEFGDPDKKPPANPLDNLILTILSQSTSDRNRDTAFTDLKERFPDWESAAEAETDEIAAAIRPGGLANQKSARIKDILRWVKQKRGDYKLDWLKDMTPDEVIAELTQLKGIGVKTAAVLLCFSFEVDIFPVDVHVHRICRRLELVLHNASAEKTHYQMQTLIPPGRSKPFHLNLLKLGRTYCRPANPKCGECPINIICPYPVKSKASHD